MNVREENLRTPPETLDCLNTRAKKKSTETENAPNEQAHEGLMFGARSKQGYLQILLAPKVRAKKI